MQSSFFQIQDKLKWERVLGAGQTYPVASCMKEAPSIVSPELVLPHHVVIGKVAMPGRRFPVTHSDNLSGASHGNFF